MSEKLRPVDTFYLSSVTTVFMRNKRDILYHFLKEITINIRWAKISSKLTRLDYKDL